VTKKIKGDQLMMKKNRKSTIFILAAIVCFMSIAGCNCKKGIESASCAKNTEKPSRAMGEEVSLTATVEAIDYETRQVTLKGPEGRSVTLVVAEDAYNFNQVDVGDLVDIIYSTSVVIQLEEADDSVVPSHIKQKGMIRAPEGQKPEGAMINVIVATAIVEDISYENRTVDLRGTYGSIITVDVAEHVKNFNNIKKGDVVNAQYTEAMAISVRPAE
jgi:hypothetical protein